MNQNPRRNKRPKKSGRARPRPFSGAVLRQPTEELKQYVASAVASPVFDGAGTILQNMLSGVGQGIGDNQRIGDHLYLQNIRMRFQFNNNWGAGSNLFTTWRVIVFQFLGDNTNVPLVASLLLQSAVNAGTTQGAYSFMNIDYTDQYVVLYDNAGKLIQTTGSGTAAGNGSIGGPAICADLDVVVPLQRCNRNIRFYAGGATGPNHVYVLVTTDQASAAVNPLMGYGFAVRFTDA
jgi:hypothetical protein